MGLSRCRRCGLPRNLSHRYTWRANGSITSRADPTTRMVFFEASYYPFLWAELEGRLGVNITELYVRGQKASVHEYLERNVLYGWRRLLVRSLPFATVIQRVVDEMSLFGFGRLRLEAFRRHGMVVVRVANPFDIISIAWGAKGFYELVEGRPAEMAWFKEGEDYLLTAMPAAGAREAGEPDGAALIRLRSAKEELADVSEDVRPAEVGFESCPSCGLPSPLTVLEWREEEGAIYHRLNGARYIFSTGYVLLSIIRELEEMTGRSLDRELVEITRNYHLKNPPAFSARSEGEVYREMAERLMAFGYGVPLQLTYGAGYLEMALGNPFHPPRLVGYVTSVFETLEESESDVSYHFPESRVLRLEVRTA
ncbi:hypothetical protein [Candidatus Solincola sp.]|nr:hypothetical protein [Actinomycetota bacterium]